MGGKDVLGSSGQLGKKGAFYRSPRKRAVAGNLPRRLRSAQAGDSCPTGDSGVISGCLQTGQQSSTTLSTKKKFQTGDSGLGPETPAYRKTAETAKRKQKPHDLFNPTIIKNKLMMKILPIYYP